MEKGDISLKAVEAIKKCKKIYLESYTSTGLSKNYLQKTLGKEIESKPRSFFEGKSQLIIKEAKSKNVALLIQGDCLSATTHISLLQEASDKGAVIEVIHGISIFTAITETGLSLYNFGKTASITFENENVKTPYGVVKNNLENGMHSLILLDLNPQEKRFLSSKEGLAYLLKNGLDKNAKAVICSRLGTKRRDIKFGKVEELVKIDLRHYPQCIILIGNTHFVEEDYLNKFKV